jgi:very-short-patch-repair endonuclease
MKRVANPIQTTELCSYGCGSVANFINGSNRLMCCKSSNSCPENKKKNSKKCKEVYDSGSRVSGTNLYSSLSQETKDKMNWAKGLTKETNASLATMSSKLKGRPGISRPHSEETKKKLSVFRTQWLKNPENRKNLGRHKRSWMELTFESYLKENNITGWNTEVHFWNDDLKKNYFPDFIFESKKLIIELDGTQHRKTVEQDAIRDKWFSDKGYKVIRIPHPEFKERYFSGKGFLELIGDVA